MMWLTPNIFVQEGRRRDWHGSSLQKSENQANSLPHPSLLRTIFDTRHLHLARPPSHSRGSAGTRHSPPSTLSCSATGIIRRQPDIKWHRKAEDIGKLAELQSRILRALWPLLKPGGRLLYCTCSVLKAENEFQINAFLSDHKDADVVPLDGKYGHASGLGRQRFPGENNMDGFFYALLHKRN